MMVMTDNKDNNKSYRYLNASYVLHTVLCHYISAVPYLLWEILFILCQFCSWENWGPGRCPKPCGTKSSQVRLLCLHSVHETLERDSGLSLPHLHATAKQFHPCPNSILKVYFLAFRELWRCQADTCFDCKYSEREPSKPKEKGFPRLFVRDVNH